MSAIILGKPCRFCPRQIPLSVAHLFGDDEVGYICPECLAKEQADLAQLGRDLSNITIEAEGNPMRCPMCGRSDSHEQRLVMIDGRQGLICAGGKCEEEWARKNREKIGPVKQFELKLR